VLEKLYALQRKLVKEMPEVGTSTRDLLDSVDELIDELEKRNNNNELPIKVQDKLKTLGYV